MAANRSNTSQCEINFNYYMKIVDKEVPLINGILNTALTIPTIVFNLLILVALVRTPAFHKPSFLILIGLALSDMGMGLIADPLFICYNVAALTQNTRFFCAGRVGFNVSSAVLSAMSLLTMVLASLDRYLAVILNLRYHEKVTRRRIITAITAVWVLAGILGLLSRLDLPNAVMPALVTGMIPLCTVVTFFAYVRIYKEVKRHASGINEQGKQLKERFPSKRKFFQAASCYKMNTCMFLVSCALVLCYAPFTCLWAIQLTGWTNDLAAPQEFANTLVVFNSLLNPLIYCWRLRVIRVEVMKVLRPFTKGSRERITRTSTDTALKAISVTLVRETRL